MAEDSERRSRSLKFLGVGMVLFGVLALVIGLGIATAGSWALSNMLHEREEKERIHKELIEAAALAERNQKSIEEALFQGKELYAAGRYEDAATALDRAIELAPENAEAALLRGRCFVKLKDYSNALEDFTRAVTADPKNKEALDYRAFIYIQEQMYQEAMGDAEALIALDPANGRAYKLRSDCHFYLSNLDKAKEDAKRSCELGYPDGCEAARRLKRR